jgi:hypothetical protein
MEDLGPGRFCSTAADAMIAKGQCPATEDFGRRGRIARRLPGRGPIRADRERRMGSQEAKHGDDHVGAINERAPERRPDD